MKRSEAARQRKCICHQRSRHSPVNVRRVGYSFPQWSHWNETYNMNWKRVVHWKAQIHTCSAHSTTHCLHCSGPNGIMIKMFETCILAAFYALGSHVVHKYSDDLS